MNNYIISIVLLLNFHINAQVPYMVKDIVPGIGGLPGNPMFAFNNGVFLSVNDATNGNELWFSDGTSTVTSIFKDINPGASSSLPGNFFILGSKFYFWANDGVDGTELWESNGTASGTNLLKDLFPGSQGAYGGVVMNTGIRAYYTASTSTTGMELYATDGTVAGTIFLKDIWPGTSSSGAIKFFDASNGNIYFVANDGTSGQELWKSDGTTAGTILVKDIFGGTASSNISFYKMANNILFFTANDGINGQELWRTDGTPAGTFIVKDFNPGIGGSLFSYPDTYNNKLFFVTSTSFTPGNALLWETDGTTAGTIVNNNIPGATGINNYFHSNFYVYNGNLYFFTEKYDNNTNYDSLYLFKITNSVSNITLIKRFGYASSFSPSKSMFILQTNNNKFLFHESSFGPADRSVIGISDGTTGGTILSSTLTVNFWGEGPNNKTIPFLNSQWITLMQGGAQTWDMEFHSLDATTGLESLIKNINPSSECVFPSGGMYATQWHYPNIVFCNKLYFLANDGSTGNELWATDGTSAGTYLTLDILPGSGSGMVADTDDSFVNFVGSGNKFFFYADNGINGMELWALACSSSGINEFPSNSDFSIYPNPSNSALTIKADEFNNISAFIEMTDVLGKQQIKFQSQNLNNQTIDISYLTPGIYFMEIIVGNKHSVKKFVKN